MNKSEPEIKLSFIIGLKEIVLSEVSQYPDFHIIREGEDSLYLSYTDNFAKIRVLRSVSRAYIVTRDFKYNPLYIANHKSILGDLLEIVIGEHKDVFKTFKITCAGSDSSVVRNIAEYIQNTYKLAEKEDADMKIHIVKSAEIWEIGVQITPRPLSFRNYRAVHMSGAMDPTIAYAINSLCGLRNTHSYLNVFSGSATLLIEAGQRFPGLKQLVGFDNDKKTISLAMRNIKKAGLVKKIQLMERDIFNNPDLGKFDVIASDLPFGMAVSKGENLKNLYQYFIEYCQEALNRGGRLAVYTSEHEILKKIISESQFKIIKTLELKFITAVGAYLRPKIFVCEFK